MSTLVLIAVMMAVLGVAPQAVRAQEQVVDLARQVVIRRTDYGVPHIRGETLEAAAFGLAYCQVEDYGARIVLGLVAARGELARHFGRDSLDSDFRTRPAWLRAAETFPRLDGPTRSVYEGFAAGVDRYVALHRSEFPAWVRPDFTGPDVLARDIGGENLRSAQELVDRLGAGDTASWSRAGSNAWALAPSRVKDHHAILLRNPHLDWSAGYYEAQLTVPGVLDFYGDFRIGGPFGIIGGFNRRLGWATTNNYPDVDEVYALEPDSARPDHYVFDGASVPIQRRELTLAFRNGRGQDTETRESWDTPLGPVIARSHGRIYVLKAAGAGDYRLGEQFLRMMEAHDLASWKAAMRLMARSSSNFTYADADGHIFYVWNAALPERPAGETGGDTAAVPAVRSDQVWTRLVPWDSLPQRLDPPGGYLVNSNDPFYYANLNQRPDPASFPAYYPAPRLRLRSQLSLQLVGGHDRLSLDDVIRRKFDTRMLLADRVKPDLIAAVAATRPQGDVADALALLRRWDDTAARDARGAVLFATWWRRYVATADSAAPTAASAGFAARATSLFARPWTPADPTGTPAGLADPARAASAFAWAVAETQRRWGAWNVAWGDVHRVRVGSVDVPVGGCDGLLGCFRVLWYDTAADGKLVARGGDGWILAVEFSDPPRAYSVLAYGESDRPGSPHHDDQAAMFADGRLKPVYFTEKDILAHVRQSYHPGEEPAER
jgi:acyl-homoserine-lactone acylase